MDEDKLKQEEKEKPMKYLYFLQVFALISCSTAVTGGYFVHPISNYLLNPHVVFLIGNSIIVVLFVLFRHSDEAAGDIYDEYVAAAAAAQLQPDLPPPADTHDVADAIPPCDDVAVAIEKAKRRIQRFQRTQSEKLKREISVKRRRPELLRRSETDNKHLHLREEVSEIETLSNEEFRRRVDAFIEKHWRSGKGTKTNEFAEYENYAFLKMS